MSYYDELLGEIEKMLDEEDYYGAFATLKAELKMPYIPSNYQPRLEELYEVVTSKLPSFNRTMDEQRIKEFLFGSDEQQLLAVNALDKLDLRSYLDLAEQFLCSDGLINAKVLLVESLVRQDISEEIRMVKDGLELSFIPRYVLLPEESDGYLEAKEELGDVFVHEPVYLKMALELLYKDCLFELPLNYSEEESGILRDRIVRFIYDSFKDDEGLRAYEASFA